MTEAERAERQFVASNIAEKMAALLFIIGGEDMVELGYIEFSTHRPWLTRKGCDVFYAAMEMIPNANPKRDPPASRRDVPQLPGER